MIDSPDHEGEPDSMKILILSKLLPHPRGVSGSTIVFNRIRGLVERGHEVSLLSFSSGEDDVFRGEVLPLLAGAEFVPAPEPRSPAMRLASHMLSRGQHLFCDVTCPALYARLGAMVERHGFHVVIAEFTGMGQYLYHNPFLPAVRRIVSCHECRTAAYLRAIQVHAWEPRNLMRRLIFRYIRRMEFRLYRNADHVLALTHQERLRLLTHGPDLRVSVIPHPIMPESLSVDLNAEKDEVILFVGYFQLEPNRDAVLWFARSIWPALRKRFPNAEFHVIGRSVTPEIAEMSRIPGIRVLGEIDDLRPHLSRARVFVCPIRMGSGFRPKILEAMAAGVPVVATATAAEGLPIWNGNTHFVADSPNRTIEAISQLLTDPDLARTVAQNARNMIADKFCWKTGIDALDRVVHEVVKSDY